MTAATNPQLVELILAALDEAEQELSAKREEYDDAQALMQASLTNLRARLCGIYTSITGESVEMVVRHQAMGVRAQAVRRRLARTKESLREPLNESARSSPADAGSKAEQ